MVTRRGWRWRVAARSVVRCKAVADDERTVSDRPRSAAAAVVRTGGTPLDRFELGDEIARGGMGRVVEARDRLLGRYVAIKQVIDVTGKLERTVTTRGTVPSSTTGMRSRSIA